MHGLETDNGRLSYKTSRDETTKMSQRSDIRKAYDKTILKILRKTYEKVPNKPVVAY